MPINILLNKGGQEFRRVGMTVNCGHNRDTHNRDIRSTQNRVPILLLRPWPETHPESAFIGSPPPPHPRPPRRASSSSTLAAAAERGSFGAMWIHPPFRCSVDGGKGREAEAEGELCLAKSPSPQTDRQTDREIAS